MSLGIAKEELEKAKLEYLSRSELIMSAVFVGSVVWELQYRFWNDETVVLPEGEFHIAQIGIGTAFDNKPMAESNLEKKETREALMGHNIRYKGGLEIRDPYQELTKFSGEDFRDHPEWTLPEDSYFYYIDFELDRRGNLVHNGAEKSYDGYGQLETILLNSKIELFGIIRYRSDYGEVGNIHCIGKEIELEVLLKGK